MPTTLADLTDADLWDLCTRGREDAWAALVQRYRRLVYTVPRRAGLDAEACADVFQSCFQRLYEHVGRLHDPERLRAWLVTTAKRESLRLMERARQRAEVSGSVTGEDGHEADPLDRVADPSPLPEDLLASLEEHHRLQAAVGLLDCRSRRFVELLFLQDEPLPYSDIAERLGMAEGSIGPTRARVLAKLRALLAETDPPIRS